MVLINCILSTLLLLGLLIFKYIFKRKINLLYLLIIISIVPIISIFRAGTYESGDLSLHAKRLISFYNLLINYKLIPRWTPEFNSGYGDPHFLFAYFLPYFTGSIFHFIGFSLLTSLKLLLAFSFIASGITMFLWVKDVLGEKSGFVASIFYLFTPYHLVDMHFRVTVAENLSFVFLPLILLAIKKNIENNNRKWFLVLSISTSLLILSHQAISVMFLPIMISYCLFVKISNNDVEFKNLIPCIISITLGFLIASFYWIPIITLAKYTQQGINTTPISFPNITELLYSPWRYGLLFQGHKGELSYLIGYTQLLIIFLSVYLLFKKTLNEKLKSLLIFFLITFLTILVMMLPITKFIWENTPLLKYSQYSTRLLVPLSFCISIIAGIVAKKINKTWFIILLCFFTIFYTILNWGNRGTISNINDNYLKREFNLKPDIGGLEPTSPVWANYDKSKPRTKPKFSIEIIRGNAVIDNTLRNPIYHTYLINAESNIEIKENTFYFPGWIVEADGKEVPISYENPKFPGVITFNLDKGYHIVRVMFVDLPVVVFSKWLSGLSTLTLLVFVFIPKKYIFH
jgi:hypothetical protein